MSQQEIFIDVQFKQREQKDDGVLTLLASRGKDGKTVVTTTPRIPTWQPLWVETAEAVSLAECILRSIEEGEKAGGEITFAGSAAPRPVIKARWSIKNPEVLS